MSIKRVARPVVGMVLIASAIVGCVVLAAKPDDPPPPPPPAPATTQALRDVNVQMMLRGYCYAGSRIKDDQAFGGFGPSDNFPWSVPQSLAGRKDGIFLHAAPDEALAFAREHKGFALYLVNASGKRSSFHASDSRLYLVQEAKDETGTWKPVEYLPSSWCGNSYHRVLLESGQCWRFAAPRYTGTLKTKLRFVLQAPQETPIYSNEFDGAVNPKQFTTKQGHTPTNIMDPYND